MVVRVLAVAACIKITQRIAGAAALPKWPHIGLPVSSKNAMPHKRAEGSNSDDRADAAG